MRCTSSTQCTLSFQYKREKKQWNMEWYDLLSLNMRWSVVVQHVGTCQPKFLPFCGLDGAIIPSNRRIPRMQIPKVLIEQTHVRSWLIYYLFEWCDPGDLRVKAYFLRSSHTFSGIMLPYSPSFSSNPSYPNAPNMSAYWMLRSM